MSSNEVLCDEILVRKLCSPPPKPPRRRHSDQASGSNNRKKHFNGHLSLGTKMKNIISISGSESLPPNWNPESPKSKMKKEKPALKKSGHFFGKIGKSLFQVSPPGKNNFVGKQFNSPENNKHEKGFSMLCPSTIDQLCEPNSKIMNNHLLNAELPNLHDPELSLDSTKNSLKQCGDSKIIHRRHHSDPLLSTYGISIKTGSNIQFDTPFGCSFKDSKSAAFMKNDDFQLNEIKIQKEINDKLWQHLCSLQAKLDSVQNSQISPKNDDSDCPSFAELMFDVYKSQREKDTASQNRLQAAIDLKDSAIQELEGVLRIVLRNFECDDACVNEDESTNKELAHLFRELEAVENPGDILQKQHALLAYLYQAKESKIKKLSHALHVAEEERDKALLENKRLEEESCRLKTSSGMLNSCDVSGSNKWEASMLDTVFEIVNQHDTAFAKIKSLQAQIISHTQESGTSDYNNLEKVNTIPPYVPYRSQIHELAKEINNDGPFETTTDDVELLKSELNNLAKLFHNEVKKRQIAEASCVRLRRMLNFLLERVNGLNIGVPV